MNEMRTNLEIPEGYREISFSRNPFIAVNGPLYGKIEDEKFIIGLRVEPRHCNPNDRCHGGMLLTICDMVLAIGSNFQAKLQQFLPTVNLVCDFLAPALLGAWIEGRVEVLRTTRNLVFSQAMLTADGAPIARANGIYKIGTGNIVRDSFKLI
jgi:uncharacterized protein (TIGR00369 family)